MQPSLFFYQLQNKRYEKPYPSDPAYQPRAEELDLARTKLLKWQLSSLSLLLQLSVQPPRLHITVLPILIQSQRPTPQKGEQVQRCPAHRDNVSKIMWGRGWDSKCSQNAAIARKGGGSALLLNRCILIYIATVVDVYWGRYGEEEERN